MDNAETSIAAAPMPTEKTVRDRVSLPKQSLRFAILNLRMIKMIRKGHH